MIIYSAYRVGTLECDVNLVDIGPMFGHVTGDLPSGECDVDALSGFERDARCALKSRADQIHFGIFTQLACRFQTYCVLGDGHRSVTSDLVHLGRFDGLDHARIIEAVFAEDHNFGADDGTFSQTLTGRHFSG